MVILVVGNILFAQDKGFETDFRGFMDVNFAVNDSASFRLGKFDLYNTSRVSDRISFLSEVISEVEEDGKIKVHIARIIATYEYDNYLKFSMGRVHTAIGMWTSLYLHSTVLQPTADRPLLFKFEDEGGILPTHSNGASVSGDFIGKYKFGYQVMVANGIGSTDFADNNKGKSFNASFSLNPIKPLKLGVAMFTDKITAGTPTMHDLPLAADMRQSFVTGSVDFTKGKFRFITEYVYLINDMDSIDVQHTQGFYAYAGYSIGKITPYARYDWLEPSNTDPYFELADIRQFLGGLRYDFNYKTNLKLEYTHTDIEGNTGANIVRVQWGIAF